jgi:hypothetical protein
LFDNQRTNQQTARDSHVKYVAHHRQQRIHLEWAVNCQLSKENDEMIKSIALGLLALTVSASVTAMGPTQDYEVTITNITKGQSFTPTLLVTHKSDISLFTTGEMALDELATLAESGNTAPLQNLLDGLPGMVADTNTSAGLLFPGDSVTMAISSSGSFDRVSFAAMLIPTNDTFVALNSLELPKEMAEVTVPAYDAGSELNDELCANIPGPDCGDMDNSGGTGEGYVYIGNGIRGIGDLDEAEYDWNNPVARVVVRRIR